MKDLTESSSSSEDSGDSDDEEDRKRTMEISMRETLTAMNQKIHLTARHPQISSSGQGKYLGNFTLTAYCNCAQCCGTAGNLTASGTVPTAGRTVAMAGVPLEHSF